MERVKFTKYMKYTTAELMDLYSILMIKDEHGLDVKDQMDKVEEEIKDVPIGYLEELYKVNKIVWLFEDLAELVKDTKAQGYLYQGMRIHNKKRVQIKNKISKMLDERTEKKSYDPLSFNEQ